MHFNDHWKLKDKHAFLGASQCSWLNYDEERLITVCQNMMAKERGTRLHAFAAECISLNQKLPRSNKTLNLYVNDAIGYHMTPEQILYYSDNCFGTADAILFKNNFLRIHDLKTGVGKTHIEQLEIYAALFCLEYKFDPEKIGIELRIYQNDEVRIYQPLPEEIRSIMNQIIEFDKIIEKVKIREGL